MIKILIMSFLLTASAYGDKDKETSSDPKVDMKKMFESLRSEMQGEIAEAKKCAVIVSKVCGDLNLNECVIKKASAFPSHCRKQISQVGQTQANVMKTMQPCLDKAMKACPMPDIDPSKKMSALKSYQLCMEEAMKKDEACVALMEKKAKELVDPKNKSIDSYKVFVR